MLNKVVNLCIEFKLTENFSIKANLLLSNNNYKTKQSFILHLVAAFNRKIKHVI